MFMPRPPGSGSDGPVHGISPFLKAGSGTFVVMVASETLKQYVSISYVNYQFDVTLHMH